MSLFSETSNRVGCYIGEAQRNLFVELAMKEALLSRVSHLLIQAIPSVLASHSCSEVPVTCSVQLNILALISCQTKEQGPFPGPQRLLGFPCPTFTRCSLICSSTHHPHPASGNQRAIDFLSKRPAMARSTLLAPTCFCLFLFIFAPTTIATPAPVPAPANGDPCGPTIQDTPDYPNTCSIAPALVASPQPYGINCTAVTPVHGLQTVAWENCSASYESLCTKALDSRTRKGVWIWSELAQNCGMGFYLPPYQGSAQLLNKTRCIEIFTALTETCATVVPPSNFGGVNLRTIPGYIPDVVDGLEVYNGYPSHNQTYQGTAVNVGYPSYAISFLSTTNPNA